MLKTAVSFILWSLLFLLVVFLMITVIRALFFTPKKKKGGNAELTEEKVDTERYCESLSSAIKIKTISNYDRNLVDWDEFKKFHAFLEERYPLIHKTLSKIEIADASLIYKWEGSDPSLDGIALLSHQDVVPITEGTEKDWEHEPFEGYNDGEYIWGRGAMDMKNHLIAVMESVEQLIKDGYKPTRTVYLCLGHNEEVVAAPDNGAKQIAAYLKEQGVHLEAVLDEGGAMLPVNVKGILNCNLAGVGVAEKGSMNYEISVSGKGGHSSQPPKHTALGHLANVIKGLENNQFRAKMPRFVYELFSEIGRRCSYPARLVTCNLWLLKPLILKIMTAIPPAASLVRSCTAVTMAQGSPQFNVLPQKASITVNFRTMPGVTFEDVERHIEKSAGREKIEYRKLVGKEASKVSPTDSRAFKTIKNLCESVDSKNLVAPFLVMGGTDAYNYEPVCDNIYRYSPFLVSTGLLLCTHGTNERLPVASAEEALKFFKRYIKEMTKD
ncbi:MAG: M20/M25/M40 family metallo-hydrolase [Ruminococcaceae bacterium]|nr:M20/M25/M40 family metallo-hydrolase [Oscillospiraceae bacterium]